MHRILKAVVDTGPLLSVLVLKYASTLHPEAAAAVIAKSRISPYVRTPADQAGMVSLFGGIHTLLTTSHVVGELQGLQHLQDQRRREFWLYAMTWLASKGMQEELVRLLDLNSNTNRQKAVCEIGPTDTGLVELAFREGAVLLTDDERMFAHVDWAQGVDCRLVKNLLLA